MQDDSTRIPINQKLLQRIFSKVFIHADMWYRTTPCWLWTGSRCKRKGYGRLLYEGKPKRAHQVLYLLFVGPIREETIDHLCRVRNCVNPVHLEAISSRGNTLRGNGVAAQNARKTHCKYGHEFTPENTRCYGINNRQRGCRQCAVIYRQSNRFS